MMIDELRPDKPLLDLLARIREVQYALLPHNIEAEYLKAKEEHDGAFWDEWKRKSENQLIVESCSIGIWGRIKFV